jgi:hypothetical protein
MRDDNDPVAVAPNVSAKLVPLLLFRGGGRSEGPPTNQRSPLLPAWPADMVPDVFRAG